MREREREFRDEELPETERKPPEREREREMPEMESSQRQRKRERERCLEMESSLRERERETQIERDIRNGESSERERERERPQREKIRERERCPGESGRKLSHKSVTTGFEKFRSDFMAAEQKISPCFYPEEIQLLEGKMLAVIHGMRKFHHILNYKKFIINTDSKAFNHLITLEPAQGMVSRWIAAMVGYDFEVRHRPGKQNLKADALSRSTHLPEATPEELAEDAEYLNAIQEFLSEEQGFETHDLKTPFMAWRFWKDQRSSGDNQKILF